MTPPRDTASPGGLLKFMTCGSVDDGKSTLIGRLLYEQNLIMDDQLKAVERDSKRHGTTGGLDLALLMDGLEAEREQGITIDVAYRYFSTPARKFIVADAPGHEQYTRNMATAASVCDVAVLLVDARKGLLPQTRRHSIISSLFGIAHVVVAVNKMDLMGYSEAVFRQIEADYGKFARSLGFSSIATIPLSARDGDNVTQKSDRFDWYDGPALLGHLEGIDVTVDVASKPFRMGVQWVNRPNADFRGYAGTVASGEVRPGDPVVVAGSGVASSVARIVTMDGDLEVAGPGASVTLTLVDEIDVSRGDILAPAKVRPQVADQFAVKMLWLGDEPMLPGRLYTMKIGSKTVAATVTALKHRIDIDTLGEDAARELELNAIGVANISLGQAIAFDPFTANRETGAFILVDRYSNATVAAGTIDFALRRSQNLAWQALDVDKAARAAQLGQKPAVIWMTGLSGSGKSTIANLVEKRLFAMGRATYVLDGDNVRHGLARDLGFTDADRVENIRRVGEVARLFVDAGLMVIVSFISPFRSERRMARDLLEPGEFLEVHVDASVEVCAARDPKGLYARAFSGEIANFTGVSSPYEPPQAPELHIDTARVSPQDAAEEVVAMLKRKKIIS
ncbi:Sulfate adenylyltransferase subunit 1 / Adenylylsulfate kinase [hydrothermal vent metagenome]|uniref:Sulfate adenylyltransferase subunit 1 / Adenylylsulfate kinase n=1 Tax=hydrothermal vent metagenome TaxID=652676 RepID=A0A3B0T0E4_9ZZZZ